VDLTKVFKLGPLASKFRHLPPTTIVRVENVLSNLLDLHGPPTRALLAALSMSAKDSAERTALQLLSMNTPEGQASYQEHIQRPMMSVLDVLLAFKSASITFSQLVELCSIIKPRYYSISSSPSKPGQAPGVCQISCGLLQLQVEKGAKTPARTFHGYSSGFLNQLKIGTRLRVFINPAIEFHMPADLSKPIVMIATGTGLAPFMGFLENLRQAKQQGVAIGENVLFFGCRKKEDYIYQSELKSFLADGIISHLRVAFSREDPKKVQYVQHIYEECSNIAWRLVKEGAYVYICGSKAMRADVKAATAKIIMKESGMNETETSHCMLGLWANKHYIEDVWG